MKRKLTFTALLLLFGWSSASADTAIQVAGTFYNSLQEAYNAAPNGGTILCKVVVLEGGITANETKTVNIAGGHNDGWDSIVGKTTIAGAIVMQAGSLVFGNCILDQNNTNEVYASSEYSADWVAANAVDGSAGTCWSSSAHASAANTEWIVVLFPDHQFQPVNQVMLLPRYINSEAVGFPVDFNIYWSDGSNWNLIRSETAYPTPGRNDWIILPLPSTVVANGIKISATSLGLDVSNNYVFQLAEVSGSFDPELEQFVYLGNNGAVGRNEIRQVGSGAFSPDKISNWNFDQRRPLIASQAGVNENVYAATIVQNEGAWNIYFGGWDGTAERYDRISMVTTNDDFMTFSPHYLQIDSGEYAHVNNPCAIKTGPSDWRMLYTTFPNENNTNKTGYATASNGIDWTPSAGDDLYRINMGGYSVWDIADVNGGNVVYYQDREFHLYFSDFTQWNLGNHRILHAVSSDFVNYTYTGIVLSEARVPNDLKAFDFDGEQYFLLGAHCNTDRLWCSLSTDLNTFPASQTLVQHMDANDAYMVSIGFVTDGTRLYGALYGAGPTDSLDHNQIFAVWLQKKVLFTNEYVSWGNVNRANGPDKAWLYSSTPIETGRFSVYDSDGTTLLYQSPRVTMREGDVWDYRPAESKTPSPRNDTAGPGGGGAHKALGDSPPLPSEYALGRNYPNPFNPRTTIDFQIPVSSHVRLRVYNVLGQCVKTLVDCEMEAGVHTVHWNGVNDAGQGVSAGSYFYRLETGKFTQSQKMLLLK